VRDEAEVWFSGVTAFPENVRSMGDIPRARILQLSSGTSSSPLNVRLEIGVANL
jgi:hypothetical protein